MEKKLKIKFLSAIIIGIVLLPTFIYFIIPTTLAQENSFQNISVQEAYTMTKKEKNTENLAILDVRDTTEFNLGHLYDSFLIPLNDLEIRIGELEDYKTSEIIIYCKSGYRSQQASEILVEYGFTQVYNMLGGILAWIDADYPIWTTSHYITVDKITDKKFELLIEPQLLYYSGCYSCDENYECPSQSESISITSDVLEQGDNYLKTITYYDFNGMIYESIHTSTLLWSYKKVTNNINKTIYFTSTEIMSENSLFQSYQLDYFIDHQNYKLTIHTTLEPEPQNLDTYSVAFSTIKYVPVNGNPITSMEFIKFNMSVTLSQQYDILADVTKEMAKIYKKSKDLDLMELYYGYTNMRKEIRSLSELVREQLAAYDWQIFESYAVLVDYVVNGGNGGGDPPPPCTPDPFCIVVCNFILDLGCAVGMAIICVYECAGPCAVPPLWPACVACTIACTAIGFTLCYLIGIYGIAPGCEWLCCQV